MVTFKTVVLEKFFYVQSNIFRRNSVSSKLLYSPHYMRYIEFRESNRTKVEQQKIHVLEKI